MNPAMRPMSVHIGYGLTHPSIGGFPCKVTITVLGALEVVIAVFEVNEGAGGMSYDTVYLNIEQGRNLYRGLVSEGFRIRQQS